MVKHIVTKEDLETNPELVALGAKEGEEIEIPDAPDPEPPAKSPDSTKAPEEPNPNQATAEALFSKFPHVHTIWFDDKGAWRFYETPGTTPIERPQQNNSVDISNL
jgi:hypothetical protein